MAARSLRNAADLAARGLLSDARAAALEHDEAAVLEELFRAFVAARVKPYYLHHPDLARGTGRFRVDLHHGQALMRRLRGRVSGLCQPGYVLDLPGGLGKVPVGPCYAEAGEGGWTVEDFDGGRHGYPPTQGIG